MTDAISVPDSPAALTSTSVLAFFAADHVSLVPDAKLYVNGGFFALLRFPAFPAVLPTLGIAAVLEVPFQDSLQTHAIRFSLRGPDGNELPVRVEVQFRTGPSVESQFGDPNIVPFGTTITNVEIPAPGVYTLVMWLDNVEKKTYRIRAVQTPMIVSAGVVPPSPGA